MAGGDERGSTTLLNLFIGVQSLRHCYFQFMYDIYSSPEIIFSFGSNIFLVATEKKKLRSQRRLMNFSSYLTS